MIDVAALDRRALLRREAAVSAVVNAAISIGFFLAVFGWARARASMLALDFLPQTFGITCLGGFIPSLLVLAKIRKGAIVAAGPVPTRGEQALRVLVCAVVAMPVLGGSAALLMVAFGPATLAPLAALAVKAAYGGLVGIVTTPPILRKALGMPYWPSTPRSPISSKS